MIPEWRNVLVVVPAYLKINWQREIEKWYVIRKPTCFIVNAGEPWPRPATDGDTKFFIVNYDVLHRYLPSIGKMDACILDECHYVKGKGARRAKAVLSLRDRVGTWIALSGTPALNRPVELWNIVNLLAPRQFPNYFSYAKRYCGGENTGWGFEAKGCTNSAELQLKLRSSIMIRRLKVDVLTELPEKRRQIIELPAVQSVQLLLDEEKRIWKLHEDTIAALRERRAIAEINDDDREYIEAGRLIAREFSVSFKEMAALRLKIAEQKVPLVHHQVMDSIDGGPIVTFFHHKSPAKALHKMLEKDGINPLLITGDDTPEERQASVDRFQNQKDSQVIVGTIGAMGTGLTLTRSCHTIFAELDWRPGILAQAEDRLHRIGQEQSVLVQYLLFADSLDARMMSSILDKMENLKAVLDDETDEDPVEIDEEKPKKRNPLKGVTDADERALIHEAIKMVAANDADLARVQNGTGFNRYDSFLGHRLANESSLNPRAAALGKRMIKKYRKQLGGLFEQLFPEFI